MSMEQFMKELEFLLQDVSDEDKEDALQYYRDYLEEAGPEREAKVLEEFGSPERVAAMIRADLAGNLKDGGEFTDHGYDDERYRDPNYQVAKRFEVPEVMEKKYQEQTPPRTSKTLKIILWIVLILVAAPAVLGIGGGAVGLLTGAAGCLIALAVCGGVFTICFLIAGVAVGAWGIVQVFLEPVTGLLFIGIGLLCLGLGLLLLAFSVLFYGKFLPWLIRVIVDGISSLLHRERRKAL